MVSLRRLAGDDGTAILTIKDDGPGFTPAAKGRRQGIGLVQRLIEQVRGSSVIATEHGTAWIISFPVAFVGGEWPVSGDLISAAAAD